MCNTAGLATRIAGESRREFIVWPVTFGTLLVVTLLTGATLRDLERSGGTDLVHDAGESEVPRAIASLSLRPSHNGVFQAVVVEGGEAEPGSEWVVRVTDAVGEPVTDARIDVEVWMPESGERSRLQPRSGAHRGDGEYAISNLDFPRSGWWNVALRIAAEAGTDSLAFNLILPAAPERIRLGALP